LYGCETRSLALTEVHIQIHLQDEVCYHITTRIHNSEDLVKTSNLASFLLFTVYYLLYLCGFDQDPPEWDTDYPCTEYFKRMILLVSTFLNTTQRQEIWRDLKQEQICISELWRMNFRSGSSRRPRQVSGNVNTEFHDWVVNWIQTRARCQDAESAARNLPYSLAICVEEVFFKRNRIDQVTGAGRFALRGA